MNTCQDIATCLCDSMEDLVDIYQQEYDTDCLCEDIPRPNPKPKGKKCCQPTSRECQDKFKRLQHRWTVKHTRGNVKDWWDRVTLEHETLTPGFGRRPRCGDLVTVTYITKRLDGMSLDWSRKPYRFIVGDPTVMTGLNKAITRIHKGERARIYIPSEMAYGWRGVEGMIPAHTDVIMTVTLNKIK